MQGSSVLFGSARADWRTPPALFDALHREFRFSLDVCATKANKLCDRWIGPDHHEELLRDAATCTWGEGEACFMNPPYSRDDGIDIYPFIERAHCEARNYPAATGKGNTVVALVPARTDTRWWHDFIMSADEIRLIPRRVKFLLPDGTTRGGASFPSAVVIWRPPVGGPIYSPRLISWDYL